MDGFKERLSHSIQLRLSFWLSLAVLGVAILAGAFSFAAAFKEAHALQDDILRQVANLCDSQNVSVYRVENGRNRDSRLFIQYLENDKLSPAELAAQAALPLPSTLLDGLNTIVVKRLQYRVFVKSMPTGERVSVAQETDVRDEIARHSASHAVMPLLILMPILFFVITSLVRRMLQPVATVAAEINQRGDEELHHVQQNNLPLEIRPFVKAINRLLDRVAVSMAAKRRFVADAAHELRSPLTALSLQAERLADAEMSDVARERLVVLRKGIERGRNLLEQLLTLSRAQSEATTPRTFVSVRQTYRSVLEDLMPLAEAKQIDIGVEGESDVQLLLDEMDLRTIIKNLIDNAIRYTPMGGHIDLMATSDAKHAVLEFRDSGPGIPPSEHERVFDSFYRVLGTEEIGSGLGLSIVKVITDRIGARVLLGYADDKNLLGLYVKVLIPIAFVLTTNG